VRLRWLLAQGIEPPGTWDDADHLLRVIALTQPDEDPDGQ
jgi:hypothetical protein